MNHKVPKSLIVDILIFLRFAQIFLQVDRFEAQTLSTRLVEELGFHDIKDLSGYSAETLSSVMNVTFSKFQNHLLADVLKVRSLQPNVTRNMLMFVGGGFDIFNDEKKPFEIFKMKSGEMRADSFGIILPNGMELYTDQQTRSFMDYFQNQEQYVKRRLTQLNLNLNVNDSLFGMKMRAGNFTAAANANSNSAVECSFLLEKRLFKVELRDLSLLQVNDNFKESVINDLPESFHSKDHGCCNKYSAFYDNWGHFVITAAYGGGSLEIKTMVNATQGIEKAINDVRMQLEASIMGEFDATYNLASSTNLASSNSTHNLLWHGGDSNYHSLSLRHITRQDWKLWLNSLAKSPALLTTEMSLTPISEMVALVNKDKKLGCREALHYLLGGNFKIYLNKVQEIEENLRKSQETNRAKIAETVKPKSEKSCFPGSAKIWVRGINISKNLCDLSVGDEVLAFDAKTNELIYSPIFTFAHRSYNTITSYLKIVLSDNSFITISDKHLILANDKMVFAEEIKLGDVVKQVKPCESNFDVTECTVIKINRTVEKDFFAPFTLSGTIVVNNIFAACYANVSSFSLAHICVTPLRWAYYMGLNKIITITSDNQEMPVGIKCLTKLMKPFLYS